MPEIEITDSGEWPRALLGIELAESGKPVIVTSKTRCAAAVALLHRVTKRTRRPS